MHDMPEEGVDAMITPVFAFDRHEQWYPVGVDDSVARYGYQWSNRAHRFETSAGLPVERLDFPRGMKPDPTWRPTVYHRLVEGGGLNWHQFWLWYMYNPWSVVGYGAHEGDWEFVQLGCRDAAGEYPILVTGSQHKTGGKREYWACALHGDRPMIYVARGSHANYLAPGAQGGGIDRCDPVLILDNYEVREFGAWASWDGRWGNSDNSPISPARHGAYLAPHLFHSAAK
jgi:hypothetical protein